MQKKIDKILPYFFLLFPVLDFLTGILTWNNVTISIGLIIKGVFLLYTIIYLLKNYPNKKIFLFMGLYFVIYLLYIILNNLSLKETITNLVKIFYLPIIILFFSNYENKKITKREIAYLLFTYLLLYLIPYFFNIGHNISEVYENKSLYLSYFYIGNELVNVFIILLPTTILFLTESNNYLLKTLFAVLLFLSFILLGTKAFYLGLVIIFIYFFVNYKNKIISYLKKRELKSLLLIVSILTFLVIYIPKMDIYSNLKTALNHYGISKISDVFTMDNVNHIVFSNRLSYLKNMTSVYEESESLEKLLGISNISSLKNVEIDCFDIFYSIGIIGFGFYLVFLIYVLKKTKLKSIYKFSIILLFAISCLSGHVLLSPMVTSYIGLLCLVSKNDDLKSHKNILLVSNMYPSNQYPHYGIFVKNVYEILSNNNYEIDMVVIKKADSKALKVIRYLKFYLTSFWLSLWNNYDYVYVHFISHSSLGVFLPVLTSKNTKLVLNAHGNDIVSDTKKDEKNIRLSRYFLKYADIVIAPSNYFKECLVNTYQVSKKKIVVYPSGGVDLNIFKRNPKIKRQENYFGFVSRIEKDKGYDTLILAINELKKQHQLVGKKFLIVGSGSEEEKMYDLIKKYKLSKYIKIMPLTNQENLSKIYNEITALIYPTNRKSESLGLTGLEAMACETLVIGPNKYGPSSYLIDNVNSLTFDPEDYHELASKIIDVSTMKKSVKKRLEKEAFQTSILYSKDNTKDIILKVFDIKEKG